MAIDRRSVLKALALAPAFPLAQSSFANLLLSSPPSPTSVYILLHGMFFMEFSGGNPQQLYVVSPNHSPHHFCVAQSGGALQKIGRDINLVAKLKQGSTVSFPPAVPQFSKSLIGSSGPVAATNYRCKMILPAPKNIFGLRTDTKNNFLPVPTSNVGQAILNSTGRQLATITCLEYDPGSDGAYVENYYAEHKWRPSPHDANAALVAAKDICGSNFDLQFVEKPGTSFPPAPLDPPGNLPSGVTQADEKELDDLLAGGKLACDELALTFHTQSADVASCPQFGINHV